MVHEVSVIYKLSIYSERPPTTAMASIENDHDQQTGDRQVSQVAAETPRNSLNVDISETDLEAFDWDDLETRFAAAMKRCSEEEEKLAAEAQTLFEVLLLSQSVRPHSHVNVDLLNLDVGHSKT